MDWGWWRAGTLLGGCRAPLTGLVRWVATCQGGETMTAAGRPHVGQGWSCQKWLLFPLELCHVWAASIRNEDSLVWWWGPLV